MQTGMSSCRECLDFNGPFTPNFSGQDIVVQHEFSWCMSLHSRVLLHITLTLLHVQTIYPGPLVADLLVHFCGW